MKFISTISNSDCLFAATKMVLAHIHHDKEYLFLPNPHLNIPFNFKEVVEEGRKYKTEFVGFECEIDYAILKKNKCPIIVLFHGDKSDINHAVIIEKFYKNKIKIVDPSIGTKMMKVNDFIQQFNGYGLLVKSFVRTKCPEQSIKTIDNKSIFIVSLLEIFSASSCLIGTYFVSSEFPFFLPIIFYLVFFVSEILLRRYMVTVMENMDKKYLYEINGKINYYEYYEKYTLMKTNNILSFVNTIFSTIIVAFLVFILAMNNPLNLVFVGVVLLFSIINCFAISPILKRENIEIKINEEKLKSIKDNNEYISLTKKINKAGYKYGLYIRLEKYVKVAFYLFAVILVMALTSKTINITYIVFNIAIMLILNQYLNQVFKSNEYYEQYNDAKNYINHYFHR